MDGVPEIVTAALSTDCRVYAMAYVGYMDTESRCLHVYLQFISTAEALGGWHPMVRSSHSSKNIALSPCSDLL